MAKREGNPERAIGYIRCSTQEQQLSPDAQRKQIKRWCQHNKVRLLRVYEDRGVSGGTEIVKRPGLLAAVEALAERNAGVLIVAKRDRLARDTMISAMIERLAERQGARIFSADNVGNGAGPEQQLMRSLIDAFSQYERALIRSRTTAAMAQKRARGEKTGGSVPYGYYLGSDGKKLKPHRIEQKALREIKEMRAGGATLKRIRDTLEASGAPCRGRQWHLTTVARIVRRLEESNAQDQ